MRLSTKLGLGVGIAAALMTATLSVLTYYKVRGILQQRTAEAQLTVARNTLDKIDDALSYARRDMRILMEDEFLQVYVGSPAERTERNRLLLQEELEERSRLTGPWDSVTVLGRNGNHLLTTGTGEQGNIGHPAYTASRAAFQAAMKGELYRSTLVASDYGGAPTIVYAAPIFRKSADENEGETPASETREIIGAIIAHYHWAAITDLLKGGFPGGSVYLFDHAGRVIAERVSRQHPLPPEHRGHHLTIQQPQNGKGVYESIRMAQHGGYRVLSTYVRQIDHGDRKGDGWGLLIEQPEAAVFAPARQVAGQEALLTGGISILLAMLLSVFSYRLIRPLSILTRLTERIGQGDFRQHIDHRSNDEIGQLTDSFNVMVDQLEARRSELLTTMTRFQRMAATVPDIIYTATPPDLRLTYVSPAVESLLGFSPDEFLADRGLKERLLPDGDRENTLAALHESLQGHTDFEITYRLRHKDGETLRWFEDRGKWELDASGRPIALHGIMADVTERKHREEQLARTTRALDILHNQDTLLTRATSEDELVQGICEDIVDDQVYQFAWVGLFDPEHTGRFRIAAHTGADQAFADALEEHPFDAADDSPPCCVMRDKRPYIIQNLLQHPSPETWTEQAIKHEYASMISLPLISDDTTLGSLNLYSRDTDVFDTTELNLIKELANNLAYGIAALRTQSLHNQAREQLAHQAFHDSLTGLPNRAMFIHSLQATLAHGVRDGSALAVLFIDLDDFKLVNDTLGHPAGDELLRQVGERISACIRGNDLVARQGGDEFIVLMSSFSTWYGLGDDLSSATDRLLNPGKQAQRLIEQLSKPFTIEGQQTYIGASIGIAVCPHDTRDADTLLRYADSAMYRAKELGKGSYTFYSADLTERQHKRMSLANRMHQALEKGEFLLHYQPVIDLETGTMTGVEALIRWKEDTGRLISPGDFLPVAEDTGLIIPIGDWVLQEACRQARLWRERGLNLRVAINLSPRQLWHADIADTLLNTLAEIGIDSDALELEVTETAMSHDPEHMEAVFRRFQEGGLRIALDDFGTGYSSLSRLKHLPIHTLKIDRSFVDGVPDDEDDTAIVTATMQLARSLGISSLAEGIETRAQWEWLREQGCRYGQGFYFSPPVVADEIDDMLEQGRRWLIPVEA